MLLSFGSWKGQSMKTLEDLSPLELNTLKRPLGINDTKWRTFKAKFIEGSSPEDPV